MTLAFYFDDNCASSSVIRGLRSAGISAVRSVDTGTYGVSDPDHLEYAASNNLVVVTSDVGDFARLSAEWLRSGRTHCGIVVIKQQHFPVREQIRRLTRVYAEAGEEGLRDRVEFLTGWAVPDP